MELKFQIPVNIDAPIAEVFDAVYNPEKIVKYFHIADRPMDVGIVMWAGPEAPDKPFPISVTEMKPSELIKFTWSAAEGGYDTTVTIAFVSNEAGRTKVTVEEAGWRDTERGRADSYNNCMGWMNFACCLKAYIEHDINLRKGFFTIADIPA